MNLLRSKYYFSAVFTLLVPLTSRLFLANEEERFVQIYGNEPLTSGRWECVREIALLDDDVGLRAFARAAHATAHPDRDFVVDSSIFGTAILVFDRHRPIQIDLLKYVTGVLSFFITKGEREDNAVFYLVKFDEDGTAFRLGRHVTGVNPRRPRTNSVAMVIPTGVRHEDLPSPSNVAAVDMRHSSASVAAVGMPHVPPRAAGIRISPLSSNVVTVDVPHSPSNLAAISVPLLPPMLHSLSNLRTVGIPVVMEQEEIWDSDFDTLSDSTLGHASSDEWPIDVGAEDGLTFLDLLPEITPTLPLEEERAPTTPIADTNIVEAVVGPLETEVDSRTERNIEGSVGGRTDAQVTRSEALGGGGPSETTVDSKTERNIEGSVEGRTDAQVTSSEALGGGGPSDSSRAKKPRITEEAEEMVPAPEEIAASPATERVISEPLTGTIVEDVSQAAEVGGSQIEIPSALDGSTTVIERMPTGAEEVGVSGLEEGRTSNSTTE